MKIKVGVIFGGESVEHEVSIITAVQAMDFMDSSKYEIVPIYIAKDRIWYTGPMLREMDVYRDFDDVKKFAKKCMITKTENGFVLQSTKGIFRKTITDLDIAFPIVHGKGTEDGSLAGVLDSVGMPYVGPNVLGAAIGQDKVVLKQLLEANNIPVPKYTWFYENEYLEDKKSILSNVSKLGYPVIVKPSKLGSSIGIKIAKTEKQIEEAIEEAITYDNKVIVEEMIPNLLEVDCAVIGDYSHQETSAIGEMITDNDFLTFEDKYIGGSKGKMKTKMPAAKTGGKISTAGFEIPARLEKKLEDEIYELSKKSFKVLELSGITRFDFLVDKKSKKVYVNEPNTIPGCLAFFFFIDRDYTKLLDDVITMTIKGYKRKMSKTTSFESNVLSTFNGSKGAKGAKAKLARRF
jgi:D-alanine-D-alanine ligase and related ATP-grasp enzymes